MSDFAHLPPNSPAFYQALPKKRMAAGALITDDKKNILILKPGYRDHWLLPGGIVEENETPQETVIREIHEETGLTVTINHLLCIDCAPARGHITESLQFIFAVKCWTGDIRLQADELTEGGFYPVADALPLLGPAVKRVAFAVQAMETGRTFYLENSQDPFA